MSEVETFLMEHPDIETFDVLNYDLCGVMRGKRIGRNSLRKLFEVGFQLPASILLMDVTGECEDPDGRGFTDGDPDSILMPIPETLTTVPWLDEPVGQVLTTFFEEDGTPTPDDPRHVLTNVVRLFEELELTPIVACELEFYLIDQERTANGGPQPPIMPKSGRRMSDTQVFSVSELDEFSEFLQDINSACLVQNIPAGPASMEYAAGQMEVNLGHIDDPVLACDHSTALQRVIRGVSIKHGFEATFMAKPYLESTGSGLHIHCSLLDRDGRNIFDDGGPEGTDALHYAIGGMLKIMDESMAIFAPSINSYRRFIPDSFVPMYPTWAYNNRSTALRIPAGDHGARRFEHRVAGADANPYLTMAAVLAGVHYGLTNKINPPPITKGAAEARQENSTPLRLSEALYRLSKETILAGYLSETYCRRYRLTKEFELARFENAISSQEYEWYLLTR